MIDYSLLDFTLKDIANIHEFRKLVRTSAPNIVTVGYARKSKTNESKEAIEKPINPHIGLAPKYLHLWWTVFQDGLFRVIKPIT
jgi:hypothetical protein